MREMASRFYTRLNTTHNQTDQSIQKKEVGTQRFNIPFSIIMKSTILIFGVINAYIFFQKFLFPVEAESESNDAYSQAMVVYKQNEFISKTIMTAAANLFMQSVQTSFAPAVILNLLINYPTFAASCSVNIPKTFEIKWDAAALNDHIKQITTSIDGIGLAVQKIEQIGSDFKIFYKEGVVEVKKMGNDLKMIVDDQFAKLYSGANLTIAAFGSMLEARIGQAKANVDATLVKLPYVAGDIAAKVGESFVRNAMYAFWESFGYRARYELINRIQNAAHQDLWTLIDYVKRQGIGPKFSRDDKEELYNTLFRVVNDPVNAHRQLGLLTIGYVALHDPEMQHIDRTWWFSKINHAENLLALNPDDEVREMLRNRDMAAMRKILPPTIQFSAIAPSSDDAGTPTQNTYTVEFSPVGSVIAFAASSIPAGYVRCDGEKYKPSQYPKLFDVIGYNYGNVLQNFVAYFKVPDYRGYFLRGVDDGANRDLDSGSRSDRGDKITGDHVGTKQDDATRIPSVSFQVSKAGDHSHTIHGAGNHKHTTGIAGDHNHHYDANFKRILRIADDGSSTTSCCFDATNNELNIRTEGAIMPNRGDHQHTIDVQGQHAHSMDNTGTHDHTITISGGDKETRPKNINVQYLIKATPDVIPVDADIATLKFNLKEMQEFQQTVKNAVIAVGTLALGAGVSFFVSRYTGHIRQRIAARAANQAAMIPGSDHTEPTVGTVVKSR